MNPGRHNRIADAAIGVLAETGARGLTHRAVDAAAGEPTGTTSRYFRTREALMRGIVDRSLESLTTAMREFAEAQRPRDVEGLVEILVQAVLGAVTVERTRSTAMCELFLESRHRDPRRRQVYPLLMTTKVKERPRRPGKISGKNQITLPVAALADAHLGPGDEVLVEAVRDGELRIVRQRDPLDDLIGSAPGLSAATDVETLRDEWQR